MSHMSAEHWHGHEELSPGRRLVEYLHGQFVDAMAKEDAEDKRGERALHGSFIKTVPIETDHALIKGSSRIVMKQPHPYDTPGFYCEIFAIPRAGGEAAEADKFLLREYVDNMPAPFWLADEDGLHKIEIDLTNLDQKENPTEVEAATQEMLDRLSSYNLVASAE